MADTYQANPGSGGNIFASDDIGPGVHYPRVKISWGVDGSAVDASVTAPMPTQVSLESNQMFIGGVAVTPKYAIIDHATAGNNTIVAAVTSKKIRVLCGVLVASGTTTVRFESGADGTAKSGQMALVANVGFTLPFSPIGWCETAAGVLLNLELSAAVSVDGMITYIEV